MKQFAITAYFLILTAIAFGQTINDDMSFFNYTYDKNIIRKNKVETITSGLFFGDEKSTGNIVYYFDKEGLLIRQAILDSNGHSKREYYFKTNTRGDLVKRIQKDHEFKRVDTVTFFKYYQGGKLIKDSSSFIPIGYHHEYSKDGKLLSTVIHSNFGFGSQRRRVILNTHDRKGRIIHQMETVYQSPGDSVGSLFSDRDIFYHKNGKVEKEVEKLNGQNLWMANRGSLNYSYDSSGNLIQLTKTIGSSYVYAYDKKGLLISIQRRMKFESDAIVENESSFDSGDKLSYTFRK